MIRDQVGSYFHWKLVNSVLSFRKMLLYLYPVTVVAQAFEYNVAITFVVSIACDSVSQCDT